MNRRFVWRLLAKNLLPIEMGGIFLVYSHTFTTRLLSRDIFFVDHWRDYFSIFIACISSSSVEMCCFVLFRFVSWPLICFIYVRAILIKITKLCCKRAASAMNNYAAITIKINAFISVAIIRKCMNRTMYYLIIIIWILEIPIFGRGCERRALNSIFCMVCFFSFRAKLQR